MYARSIVQLEGSFSRTDAFFCLLAVNFVLWANEASAISEVEESIAINTFVFIVKERFQ